jgi:class 3 adenylate cyclase
MANDPDLEASIRLESNGALASGSRYAIALALFAALPVFALAWTDLTFLSAAFFPLAVAACTIGVQRLAKRGQMHSMNAGLMFGAFCLIPLAFTLVHSRTMPFGAATFFNGPINLTYYMAIALSGFMLDKNLSRLTGVLSAAFFLCGYLLARQHLEQLPLDLDPSLREDLRSPMVHLIKAMMMIGEGFIVGGLATTSRKLIQRVRDEEREKASLSSLFGQYVSPEVREKLVREKAGVKGERKLVAVLFSDLRGFTTFSENAQPAEVVDRLNQYFDRMVGVITEHGGTVDKFIGDAVMAVFGGLIPLPNPAEAALDAALAMRLELQLLNQQWVKAGLAPLDNGIGICFGEVLQGPIGSADRKEFTVIGDVVNTASRLESATKDLHTPVVLSDGLVNALPSARRSGLTALGEVKLKGKELPVTVFGVADAPRSQLQDGSGRSSGGL